MRRIHFLAALAATAFVNTAFVSTALANRADDLATAHGALHFHGTQYKVYNLGSVQGGSSYAKSVSSNGKVAGWVSFNILGGKRPAIFAAGQIPKWIATDGRGEATGINASGQVSGWFLQGTTRRAFLWTNNAIVQIPSPFSGANHAAAINDSGVVVGYFETSPGVTRAFKFQNGLLTDLGNWGGISAQATAINNSGVIAGFRQKWVNGKLVKQAVRLGSGGLMQVFSPLAGFDNIVPTEINGNGDMAGSLSVEASNFPMDAASFIVQGNAVKRITAAGCCFGSVGLSLNNSRKVVGFIHDRLGDPANNAWAWDVPAGAVTNTALSVLPAAKAAGWYQLTEAADINNNGVIVGQGAIRPAGGGQLMRAFMLVPVPGLTTRAAQ
ncbi:DUF3466 family protein [Azohydromonas aeria]|uniref:DUF3466 family protein n=1 Tax=Azohydromonas aeria TaxID=2590212 RepID=UPI0012F9882C|nr:DUF3466 family protein [Azohydromonas aeria]